MMDINEIKKIDVPKMFEGSALVKVKTCGIWGTDTHNFFDSSNKYILRFNFNSFFI